MFCHTFKILLMRNQICGAPLSLSKNGHFHITWVRKYWLIQFIIHSFLLVISIQQGWIQELMLLSRVLEALCDCPFPIFIGTCYSPACLYTVSILTPYSSLNKLVHAWVPAASFPCLERHCLPQPEADCPSGANVLLCFSAAVSFLFLEPSPYIQMFNSYQ